MSSHFIPDAPAVPGRLRTPLTRQRFILRLGTVLFLAATVWAWNHIGMSLDGIVDGLGDARALLARMLPPTFPRFSRTVALAFETLWMAVIGTVLAVTLSVPLALGAARNTTPHPLVMGLCRAVIVAGRAIPDLIFAAIFVRALGIGILPGVFALGFHSVGMVGKLFADAIEQTDPMPAEAVTSVGTGRIQQIVTSVIPQAMPSFIATTLYRLDINLRSSAVLGLVGAGGIGHLLKQFQGALRYSAMLGVVIVIFVFISLMELLSGLVRATLLSGDAAAPASRFSLSGRVERFMRRRQRRQEADLVGAVNRDSLRPPWTTERVLKVSYAAIFALLIVLAFWFTRTNPFEIFGAVPDLARIAGRMLPPDFTSARDGIIEGMLVSLAVAFVSTTLGTLLAFPLGLLAARNVAVNTAVYAISRLFLVLLRGIPELIIVVIFIAAIGLGPVPGAFALTIGTAGFFAKLIADAVEEVPTNPREAVTATGATRLQEAATSVVPPAMPALVGNLLYVLDINLRTSTVLGLVGGGGIGFLLFNSVRVLRWDTTGAILISIFAIVYLIELIAGWIRRQLL